MFTNITHGLQTAGLLPLKNLKPLPQAELKQLLDSPEYYLRELWFWNSMALFSKMTPATYQSSNFLDHRLHRIENWDYRIPIKQLSQLSGATPPLTTPAHFIFHTAFCGSTFLARLLATDPSIFSLKEPAVLYRLTALFLFLRRRNLKYYGEEVVGRMLKEMHPTFLTQEIKRLYQYGRHSSLDQWRQTLQTTLSLLSRTWPGHDKVLIKAQHTNTPIMHEILAQLTNSRALFLYVQLEQFICSCLKNKGRRAWARRRIKDGPVLMGPLHDIGIHGLSDTEAAAFLWLRNMYAFYNQAKINQDRVKALDFGVFLESPRKNLEKISQHLNLSWDQQKIDNALGSDAFDSYAKGYSSNGKPGKKYNRDTREQELKNVLSTCADEIQTGLKWAENILKKHPMEIPEINIL